MKQLIVLVFAASAAAALLHAAPLEPVLPAIPGHWYLIVPSTTPLSDRYQGASLAWDKDAATTDIDTNPVGYYLYIWRATRTYGAKIDCGDTGTYTVPNLDLSTTFYFTVTAYNAAGVESPYSKIVTIATPTQ